MKESESYEIKDNDIVTVTKMNHMTEIQYMQHRNSKPTIRKLNNEQYMILATGEIREYEKIDNRSQSENSLRQTFKKLRYLINNNFIGAKNELMLTLTYKGANMTDPKKLYDDLDKFNKRIRYRFKGKSSIDYIHVVEPHESGGFHVHSLFRFNDLISAFIPYSELEEIWGHGVIDIERIDEVDNVGAYLSAYLTDVELTDKNVSRAFQEDREVVEKEVDGEMKKFVKGGRLHLYPAGMNIYRASRGIKPPERINIDYKRAKKIAGSTKPHYSKTYNIEADDFKNTIAFEQYNTKRL